MNNGILLFAFNNSKIDYIKQAYFIARQSKKYLDLPVSIVVNTLDINTEYINSFDNIIDLSTYKNLPNYRSYYNSYNSKTKLEFLNDARYLAFELSPYDNTLLLDTDIVILNDNFKFCFSQDSDFLIYDTAYNLGNHVETNEFKFISNLGIKFYWATAVFFKKTKINKIFFNLVGHIKDNWDHYKEIYYIKQRYFRNDYAFSIAIHILNGFAKGEFAQQMPGKLFYITDTDICYKIKNDELIFLLDKDFLSGDYLAVNWKSHNIHVMNKFSLNSCIDRLMDE